MSSLANGFILPPLSAPYGAFEPVLDRLTLETHHRYIYGAAAERLYGETRLRPLLSSETEDAPLCRRHSSRHLTESTKTNL